MNKNAKMYFAALLALVPIGSIALASPTPAMAVVQQQNTLTGTVRDATGEPVVGATVRVANTNGTVTDIDGKFTVSGVERGTKVTITSIGYAAYEFTFNGQPVDVTLRDDASMLQETIVIGYGTVKKADLSGSVAVMDNKNFRDQPVARIEDALNGRMSGVQVSSSGVPGGSLKIRVRGASSVNKSNDPLYVVDGIVREIGLEGISSEDIQSIQILKDASSTAIYGARGANGVVMVTTKKGTSYGTQVVFDASMGFSNAYHIPKAMGTQEYAQALVDYKGASATDLTDYLNGSNPGIDWMDELLRTGVTQNYKVAVSKGDKDTQYYFSANYMNQTGVLENTSSTRYAVKMNVNSHLFSWLDLTADVNLAHTDGRGAGFQQNQSNPIWVGLNYSPSMEMYDANGNFNKDPYNNIENNPLGILTGGKNDRRRNMLTGHVDLKFNIAPGLTFTTTNGVDYNDYKGYSFSSTRVSTTNSMGNNDAERTQLQSTNNLTYDHAWGDHHLTATGVWEATWDEVRGMSISGRNIAHEVVGYWNISDATTRDASNSYSKWTMLSGVARVMYNYADRYLLTGTLRADGSSRFSDKKWGWFPSVSAAWTISNEPFFESARNTINYMKLRASYGIIGNQDIGVYSTLGTLGSSSFNYGTNTNYTGYWANDPATPDLTWEKVQQFDVGLDLGFWDNRISVGFDYFYKKTTDALLRTSAPQYVGGASYWTNAGEVKNTGLDFNVTANLIRTADFTWTTAINGGYLKNEVTKLTTNAPRLYGRSASPGSVDAATIITKGEAIGTFYGYKWAGLQQDADGKWVDTYYTGAGGVTTSPDADTDRFVLGHANPDVTLGWNNTLSYKNWDFNVFFNAAFGAKRLNLVRFAMNNMLGASSFPTDADYFKNVGTFNPSLDAVGNKTYGNCDKWLENADYFRCENITIAYTFPREQLKFADLRLYFSVQNLFTISGYKGIDPAGGSFADDSGSMDNDFGQDMGAYPNPRTFTIGARFTF